MKLAFKIGIKSILQQIFVVPIAIFYYKIVLAQKQVCNIIVCDHIGDFIYTMGYVNALKREKRIQTIRIVSTERMRQLLDLYPDVSCEFKTISRKWLHIMEIADRYNMGKTAFQSLGDNYFVIPANWFLLGYEGAKRCENNSLKKCIKSYCFNIQKEVAYELPTIDNTSLGKEKKVLLCMDAESISWSDAELYENEFVRKLCAMGYQVEINGKDCFFPLRAFPNECNKFSAIVGLRSGILDLAMFSNSKVVAIYPINYEEDMQYYSLKNTNEKKKNVIQYMLNENIQDNIKNIIKIIEGNEY